MKVAIDDVKLKGIIRGEVTRSFFKKYLARCSWSFNYQKINHSGDVQRLNDFICAASRFRSQINGLELEKYLIDDLGWSEQNAQCVRRRIEIGLELLQVDKKFYYVKKTLIQ